METNNLEQDIRVLHNYEHFARLIKVVKTLREECIADMHEAKTEQLQQLSGRILSYDQLLQMVGADELEKRHQDFL